ncbi:MAG TPA: hypothetical protein VK592_01100 [Candidatus Dormibacteraeota bacterium]|nr:hypothetical protein [Candidatus Dormibacteraeota bacterium]
MTIRAPSSAGWPIVGSGGGGVAQATVADEVGEAVSAGVLAAGEVHAATISTTMTGRDSDRRQVLTKRSPGTDGSPGRLGQEALGVTDSRPSWSA